MSLFALPSWRQIGIFTDDDMSESDSYTGYQSSLSTVTTPQLATWNTFEYMNNKVTRNSTLLSSLALFVFISVTAVSSGYNATEVTLMTFYSEVRNQELGKRDMTSSRLDRDRQNMFWMMT